MQPHSVVNPHAVILSEAIALCAIAQSKDPGESRITHTLSPFLPAGSAMPHSSLPHGARVTISM